jgi:hypothetical protein
MPACRLLSISSEYCIARHGVRYRNTQIAPGAPPPRARSQSHSILCEIFCLSLAYSPRSRSKTFISDREFPTTAAVMHTPLFPFWIGPLHTLPSSYIHLPNVLSMSSLNDTLHSSAVLGTSFYIAEVICLPCPEERKKHQILLVRSLSCRQLL